jgi:hypothetical protein
MVMMPSLSVQDSSGQTISSHNPSSPPDATAANFSGGKFAISSLSSIRASGKKNLKREDFVSVMVVTPFQMFGCGKRIGCFYF